MEDRTQKRNILVNTHYCRAELDTLSYCCRKYGYKETRSAGEGNLIWYGVALRDSDLEQLKHRFCMVNRYPLMDVSVVTARVNKKIWTVALCEKEHFLRDYVPVAEVFPEGLPIYAR